MSSYKTDAEGSITVCPNLTYPATGLCALLNKRVHEWRATHQGGTAAQEF